MNPQVRESDATAAANATAHPAPFVNALSAPKMVIVPVAPAEIEEDSSGPSLLSKRRKRKTRLANRR
ncbi:MAG: hypothetical protein AAF216_10545 [Pseudomonadota bacterium]